MFVWLRGSGTNLLSGPVYPSPGVSVDVDQNQTLHRVWVCELEAERRKRQSYRRKTCCDRVRPAAWSTNQWSGIKAVRALNRRWHSPRTWRGCTLPLPRPLRLQYGSWQRDKIRQLLTQTHRTLKTNVDFHLCMKTPVRHEPPFISMLTPVPLKRRCRRYERSTPAGLLSTFSSGDNSI